MPHLRAADVDETIWEEIRAWLIAPERYEKAFERCQAAQKSSAERFSAGVAQQLSTVRSDIARLQELIDRGAVREHEVRGALKNLREKEATLAAMLNAPSRPQVERFTAYDPAEVDNWDAITRREHIRGVVEQIVAFPDDRLEFYAREKTRLPKRA
jgi:multidrug resistance efflux pump